MLHLMVFSTSKVRAASRVGIEIQALRQQKKRRLKKRVSDRLISLPSDHRRHSVLFLFPLSSLSEPVQEAQPQAAMSLKTALPGDDPAQAPQGS